MNCLSLLQPFGQNILVSNEYIKYFKANFEELGKNGINALNIIGYIEEGRETDYDLVDAKQYLVSLLDAQSM